MVESLGRHPPARSPEKARMSRSPEKPDSTGGTNRLERINHWIRVILGVVIITVFIVGMIAYYFKYR